MPGRSARGLQPHRLVGVLLIAAIAYLVWERVQTERRLSSPAYLAELANNVQGASDAGRYAQMVLETRALAEAEYRALKSLGLSALEKLQSVTPTAERFATELADLRSGPRGRAIAARAESLEQFQAATAKFAVTPEALMAYEESLTVLMNPIEAAIAEQAFDKAPSPELRSKVEALAKEVDEAAESLVAADRRVQAIVAAAPAEGDGPPLAEAVTALERRYAAAEAEAVRETTARVREEYREKLAAQAAAEEQAAREAELANKAKVHEEKLRAEKQAAEAEARRIAEAAEEARQAEERRIAAREAKLKAEADEREYQAALPELEKYLAAFITPGNKQLVRDRWVYTEEKKPLSYSALKARHMMRKDNTGQLYFVSYANSEGNDRPGGPFSGYRPGHVPPAMVPDIVRAQNLLEKHADKLIEHGRLLP